MIRKLLRKLGGADSKEKRKKSKRENQNQDNEEEKSTVTEQTVVTSPPAPSQKERMLLDQQKREEDAAKHGRFAKKQIVRYFHKVTETWYDNAHIVGVHFDDGPDRPYYTIKFKRFDIETDEHGNESVVQVEVEKQTTEDRLERVEWNAKSTWEVLNST